MKHAILFSGGLDSTCAAILNPDAVLIRVSTGARYDAIESVYCGRIAEALDRKLISVDGVLDLAGLEQADALIPNRNALLLLTASAACPDVGTFNLVSVAGDGTHARDKDVTFAHKMSELMTHLSDVDTVVALPYRRAHKHELLLKAYETDLAKAEKVLPSVYSCYQGQPVHCGRCKACVRLYGAFAAAGLLDLAPRFDEVPHHVLSSTEVAAVYEGRGAEAAAALGAYLSLVMRGI